MAISQDIKLLIEDVITDRIVQHKGKLIAGAAGTAGAITVYKKNPHLANAIDQLGHDVKGVGSHINSIGRNDIVEPIKSLARRHNFLNGSESDKSYDNYQDTLAKLRGDNSDAANAERAIAVGKRFITPIYKNLSGN
jgi:hypothetical protein